MRGIKKHQGKSEEGLFEPGWEIGKVNDQDSFFLSLDGIEEAPAEEEKPRSLIPITVFRLVLIVVVGAFLMRLINLQVTQAQINRSLAEGNSVRTRLVPAPRGLFYDRNGVELARNIPNFSIVLHLTDLPHSREQKTMLAERIAASLGRTDGEITELINQTNGQEDVILADRISREEALKYELRLSGLGAVEIVRSPDRSYSNLPSLGQFIGYIGKVTSQDLKEDESLLPTSLIGKSGLEKTYDKQLRGQPGQEILEANSLGKTVRVIGQTPATVGNSIILGVDSALQEVAARALKEAIEKSKAKSGALVALDPTSGEIRAMVSLPDFDNNIFGPNGDSAKRQELLTDPDSPLINRAVLGQYPSGSTVKPFVAAGGLQEGVITPQTRIDTSAGEIVVGDWVFRDWKKHGLADVKQAIAESNNIFFYTVGGGNGSIEGLGAEGLANWLRRFGFGQPTGIDLPYEASGLIPTPRWKEENKHEAWYLGDTYNLSIGQGDLLITPLQLANATAAIANGGRLLRPHLVHSFRMVNGQIKEMPSEAITEQVAKPEVVEVVRQGMRQAVTSGSARAFSSLPVNVAAKTGTAQFTSSKEKTHSWFTAFAPYDNPSLVVSVIVEGGGEGYAVAAPVAKNVIEKYFDLPLTPINITE